ncbi:MAG: hypothetical protein SNG45_08785 [Rikenellaceae bacterium]
MGLLGRLQIDNAGVTAYSYIGALAGSNAGTISNCEVTGYVNTSITAATDANFGGLVGISTGSITGCTNYATLNNMVTPPVNSNYGNNSGGIVGYFNGGTITNCVNYGTIFSNKASGGIVGFAGGTSASATSSGAISDCKNAGLAYCSTGGNRSAGGIIGKTQWMDLTIDRCANIAGVYGTGGIGGVIGNVENTSCSITLTDCYNIGDITTPNNTANDSSSGLIGRILGSTAVVKANYCYSTGKLSIGGTTSLKGAIVGRSAGPSVAVTDCYALEGDDTQQVTITYITGATLDDINKSEAELKSASTYSTWEGDVWNLVDGYYPTLK